MNSLKLQRTKKAVMARKQKGQFTDTIIKEIVDKKPGLSRYEISKLANSSVGLVDGSIRRLEKNGTVRVKQVLRGGRSIKEVFPSEYSENNSPELKLDITAFPNPEIWENVVYLYALNRSSIGVSPIREQEWESKALFQTRVDIKKDDVGITFEIPIRFRDFYLWENSKVDISIIDELVLLNVVTEIPIVESNEQRKSVPVSPTVQRRHRES